MNKGIELLRKKLEGINRRYELQSAWSIQLQRLLANFLEPSANRRPRVLEAGCGTGAMMRSISDVSQGNWSIVGIDAYFESIQYASELLPAFTYLSADGGALPFADDSFDMVFCHYYLSWVKQPISALQEMVRVCRKGGITAAIAEPDYRGRIDYPESLTEMGRNQRDALIACGIDPEAGRKLPFWMAQTELEGTVCGMYGNEWQKEQQIQRLTAETEQLKQDLHGMKPFSETFDGTEIFHVPVFYAYGKKGHSAF